MIPAALSDQYEKQSAGNYSVNILSGDMSEQLILKNLEKTYNASPTVRIDDEDSLVIFSDLHMGNGGSRDDFSPNSALFYYILKNYYLKNGFRLVLNGDIEELYKFKMSSIMSNWNRVYDLLNEFKENNGFYKIIGNHDYELQFMSRNGINANILAGLKLDYKSNKIFIYHGHQSANYLDSYNRLSLYIVRYLLYPLRIKNITFALNSKKIFLTELRSYEFASRRKMISIIGHTHKPLFESLSKRDTLTYNIENLLRKYPRAKKEKKKRKIKKNIQKFSKELKNLSEKRIINLRTKVYNDGLLVPSLFNSGAVIGKRGLTAIEISGGKISLVYWFDRKKSRRYIKYKGIDTEPLGNSDYYKATLKEENLEYVFTRIQLLA